MATSASTRARRTCPEPPGALLPRGGGRRLAPRASPMRVGQLRRLLQGHGTRPGRAGRAQPPPPARRCPPHRRVDRGAGHAPHARPPRPTATARHHRRQAVHGRPCQAPHISIRRLGFGLRILHRSSSRAGPPGRTDELDAGPPPGRLRSRRPPEQFIRDQAGVLPPYRCQCRCQPSASTSAPANALAARSLVTTPGASRSIAAATRESTPDPHAANVLWWR